MGDPPRLRVVVSSSPEDAPWRAQLLEHLGILERSGSVEIWSDAEVEAGADWRAVVDRELGRADVALLLVSSAYLASDHLQDVEVPLLFERHKTGGVQVIPVLVRSCAWKLHPWIGKLLPKGQRPVAAFEGDGRDRALTDVVEEIARRAGIEVPRNLTGAPTNPTSMPTQVRDDRWRYGSITVIAVAIIIVVGIILCKIIDYEYAYLMLAATIGTAILFGGKTFAAFRAAQLHGSSVAAKVAVGSATGAQAPSIAASVLAAGSLLAALIASIVLLLLHEDHAPELPARVLYIPSAHPAPVESAIARVTPEATSGQVPKDSPPAPSPPRPAPSKAATILVGSSSRSANLRRGPSHGDEVISGIPRGATVTLLGPSSADTQSPGQNWYLVQYHGMKGWLHQATFSPNSPADQVIKE
jgi:hypothetical protein